MSLRVAVLASSSRPTGALELENLQGTTDDVQDLAFVLRDPELGGFAVRTVGDATTSETIDAVEEGLQQAGRGGLFLLYFSGWGVLDADERLYLATRDATLQSLSTTAMSTKFLRHLLENSPCEQALVILDCCFAGSVEGHQLTMKVSDELNRIRAGGGSTVAVLATSPRVQSPEDRETDRGGRRRGTLTSFLVDSLRSGAADLDEDGEITVGNLGEFLGIAMPHLCPSWLADGGGDALVVSTCPEPLPGAAESEDHARRPSLSWRPLGRGWSGLLAVLLFITAATAASMWIAVGSDSPRQAPEIRRRDLASHDLAGTGIARELLLTRQLAANAGWVEHPVDSMQALDSYAGATWVDPGSVEVGASSRIIVPDLGEMELELAEGTHGIGILCRKRMNVAVATVRLSDGDELRFDIETHLPTDVFYGFLSLVPIEGFRLEGRRGSLEIEQLFLYADRDLTLAQER